MTSIVANTLPPISFHAWNQELLAAGEFSGTQLTQGLGRVAVTLKDGGQEGSWTSSLIAPESPFTRVVASWQARTPGEKSWIETHLQVVSYDGAPSKWFVLGRWAFAATIQPDGSFVSERASSDEQADEIGSIDQDTFWMNDGLRGVAYRIRCLLHGNSDDKPTVRQLAVVASEYSQNVPAETSHTTMTETIELPVPPLSQYLHRDEYPQLDGGGAAWCSPTSTAMVLRYYGLAPNTEDIAALPQDRNFDVNGRRDGDVAYAAYHTFDNGYENKNTGNWPFNTAYLASLGLDASVRQYSSLRDVEAWIKQSVPVTATLKWKNSDPAQRLTGSSIEETAGHLVVVTGFTKNGDVIVNDPAAPYGNHQVRHEYRRDEFERQWLRAKGGIVYVAKPFA